VPAPVLPAPPVPLVPVPSASAPAAPAVPSPVVMVPAGTPEPAPRGFWIQFGALSSRAAAQTLLGQLDRTLREPISIEVAGPAAGEGRTFYRVHTGPYPTRAQALAKLREARRRIPARLAQPLIVEGSPPVSDRAVEAGKAAPVKARHGHKRTRRS
jgi:cell division septation protein DedD